MKDFVTGVEEKYDKRLLEGRLTAEGNVTIPLIRLLCLIALLSCCLI